jgi:hypothetical protein
MNSAAPDNQSTALSRAILERGAFYYPAGLHYGNPDTAVTCDRCRRTNLRCSIGFDRFDYCLPCVETVANSLPLIVPSFDRPMGPMQNGPRSDSPYMTLMRSDMFTTAMASGMFTTRMEGNMFRR